MTNHPPLDRSPSRPSDAFLARLDTLLAAPSLSERVDRTLEFSAEALASSDGWCPGDPDCPCRDENMVVPMKDDMMLSPIADRRQHQSTRDLLDNPVDGIQVRSKPREGWYSGTLDIDGREIDEPQPEVEG